MYVYTNIAINNYFFVSLGRVANFSNRNLTPSATDKPSISGDETNRSRAHEHDYTLPHELVYILTSSDDYLIIFSKEITGIYQTSGCSDKMTSEKIYFNRT